MIDTETITNNIAIQRERITAAAQRTGRNPDEITLVAVSKTHPADAILVALSSGIENIGENRVQEAAEKIEQLRHLPNRLTWHLIGHLQRNKARQAVRLFDLIHSLDSLRLAEALDRHMAELRPNQRLPVLLQVNVSGEESKEGFNLPGGIANSEALTVFCAEVAQIAALPNLEIQGLMTIAQLADEPEQARPVFRALRLLRDTLANQFPQLSLRHLSMGMSDDMEVAIEEGATLIRIGRAIFGART